MAKTRNRLKDPFPKEHLPKIDLGSADGYRDKNIEELFIATGSIEQFKLDRHSIIVGSFGSGKSTLFRLLKNKSNKLIDCNNSLIAPIEEQLQFSELRDIAAQSFKNSDSRSIYQIIWKLQICRNIAYQISKLEKFPKTKEENYLNEFLNRVGFSDGSKSITQWLKDLASACSYKIKASVSATPIELEVAKEKQAQNNQNDRIEINLNAVVEKIEAILSHREIERALVIIDKLDKFVTNEDYKTQRLFIESLLEVEDDFQSTERIKFKIFLRADLYDRLDLSSLGPDKVADNTLKLRWSSKEIQAFVARRLYISLCKVSIWSPVEVRESIDLSELDLRWYERIMSSPEKDRILYKFASLWQKYLGKNRQISFFDKIDKTIISILFENELVHSNEKGEKSYIDVHSFLESHFLDGNNTCTPRQILIFLKKVIEETLQYYNQNPDLNAHTKKIGSNWGWAIFSQQIVYDAYRAAKQNYIEHISRIDEKWTRPFNQLIEKVDNKSIFDYKWIASNIDFEGDATAENFLSFLQVIGFFKIHENHQDLKKRKFRIPILYKEASLSCTQPSKSSTLQITS